jgi:hypothetical protein
MRTLLAIATVAGALAWSAPDADAGRRSWRGPPAAYRAEAPQRYYLPRGNGVCQSRARFFDPNGTFRGFPCWAREAFGQGRR